MNWMMGGANSELQYALIICQHCPNLEELDSNSLVYNFHFGSQLKVWRIHYYSWLCNRHTNPKTPEIFFSLWIWTLKPLKTPRIRILRCFPQERGFNKEYRAKIHDFFLEDLFSYSRTRTGIGSMLWTISGIHRIRILSPDYFFKVEPGHFSNLRVLHVGYITWDTFFQIWGMAVNLGRSILIHIVESDPIRNAYFVSTVDAFYGHIPFCT